jgi:hypothetical protein
VIPCHTCRSPEAQKSPLVPEVGLVSRTATGEVIYHLDFYRCNYDFPVRAPQSFHDVIWRNKLHAVPHLRIWTLEKAARIPNPGSSQTRPKHIDCLFFKSIHRTLGIEPKRGLLSVFCCCR